MAQNDKKKIIILIVIIFAAIIIGVSLNYWQKNTPGSTNQPISKYEQLTPEEKDQMIKAQEKIKEKPTDNIAYIELARLEDSFGWKEEAIASYQKALEIQPGDTLALNNLANIYLDLKEYEMAESSFLKLIEINPRWVQTYTDLADLYRYYLTDKKDQVLIILKKGYENNPEKQAVFLRYLAVYYKDIGDKEKAIKNYQELLKIEPDNETAREELEEMLAGE